MEALEVQKFGTLVPGAFLLRRLAELQEIWKARLHS